MKKLILFLFWVFSLLFTCFSSANTEYDWIVFVSRWSNRTIPAWTTFDYGLVNSSSCFTVNRYWQYLEFYKSDWTFIATWINSYDTIYCPTTEWYIKNTSTANLTLNFYDLSFKNSSQSCPECPTCSPQYTSEQCQSVYWLVSSGDLSSCQSSLSSCQSSLSGWNNTLNNCSNNLLTCESSLSSCIQSNCPFDTWSVQWSALWINWIQHLWKPIINIDIPDYIQWDYTTNDDQFDLYVWTGYDVDYINSIIDINSYRPDSTDFTSIFVSGLTLIFPYIIFTLFIVFLWKILKRIFK